MKNLKRFFPPATAKPFAALRIAVAAILLGQGFLLAPGLHELYGENGLIQNSLASYLAHPFSINVAHVAQWLAPYGVTSAQALNGIFVGYLVSLSFLLLGWRTRLAAVMVYLLHSVLIYNSGFLSSYGADTYAHIVLFYFLFFPIQKAYAMDATRFPVSAATSSYHRLALRVLQVHIAGTYFVSGIAKSMGEQWWNGEIIWRSLTVPQFSQWDISWMAFIPLLPKVLGWGTLVLELGYPVFAFLPRTRKPFVVMMVLLHGGIFVGLGLHTFSLFMIALNVCLFGISAEPVPAPAAARSRTEYTPNSPVFS